MQKGKTLLLLSLLVILDKIVLLNAQTDNSELSYIGPSSNLTKYSPSAINFLKRTLGLLKNVQNMFETPTGHVVMQVAKEILHRSAGNSQVLSLNLTNLLIIILLKIAIFSMGLLGASHWSSYGYRNERQLKDRSDYNLINNSTSFNIFPDQSEAYLITGFLAAQGSGIDDCLYAAACDSPNLAYEYAKAARAILGAIEVFENKRLKKPRYKDLILLMESAAYDGYRGLNCNTTHKCDGLL